MQSSVQTAMVAATAVAAVAVAMAAAAVAAATAAVEAVAGLSTLWEPAWTHQRVLARVHVRVVLVQRRPSRIAAARVKVILLNVSLRLPSRESSPMRAWPTALALEI
eukprot:5281026-Pleurochrysis_carterae.AAC.1